MCEPRLVTSEELLTQRLNQSPTLYMALVHHATSNTCINPLQLHYKQSPTQRTGAGQQCGLVCWPSSAVCTGRAEGCTGSSALLGWRLPRWATVRGPAEGIL